MTPVFRPDPRHVNLLPHVCPRCGARRNEGRPCPACGEMMTWKQFVAGLIEQHLTAKGEAA